uniref:Chemokine interleukin-8-like domain-containing protein n=1 Tax=Paramormyrops kingsleyae TaxID=1676925 RepID=A0A3B3TBC2_9TELE
MPVSSLPPKPALLAEFLILSQSIDFYVPLRCTCLKVTEVVKEPLSDIKVIEKGPHCENNEIIVTLKTQAGDGLPREVCLNPSGKQAKRLQHCLTRYDEQTSSPHLTNLPTKHLFNPVYLKLVLGDPQMAHVLAPSQLPIGLSPGPQGAV